MLAPLTSLLLAAPILVLADLQCFPSPPEDFENLQHVIPLAPPPEDCLAIAAQIPLLPDFMDVESHHYQPSFPFFPRAYFIRGQCTVRISYSSELAPSANIHLPSGSFYTMFDRQEKTPIAPLSVTSVANIWSAARSAMMEVTAQCLPDDWAGIKWDFVNVPEIPDAWYLVEISGTDTSSRSWFQRNMRKERRALVGVDPALMTTSHLRWENRFKMTFWQVP